MNSRYVKRPCTRCKSEVDERRLTPLYADAPDLGLGLDEPFSMLCPACAADLMSHAVLPPPPPAGLDAANQPARPVPRPTEDDGGSGSGGTRGKFNPRIARRTH